MALSGSRLNSARYTSALADIQTQFPMPAGLLAAEQTAYALYQQKMAHAISDHDGTDVVTEITTNAVVPSVVAVTSVGGVTTGVGTSGPGTGTATGTVT